MFFVFQDSETLTDVEVRLAGRVHAIRESGAKLIFYDVRGESTKIQVINTKWMIGSNTSPKRDYLLWTNAFVLIS